MSQKYCNETLNLKIVFTSFKIKNYFSYKDPIPDDMKSFLVYKFNCASCNTSYIGETTRHLKTRIDEHIKRDKQSHIFKHLSSDINCFNSYKRDSFKIIDTAKHKFDLKIKEALHINWFKPILNTQVNHFNITLSI